MWMVNGYGMGTAGWLLMAVFWVVVVGLLVVLLLRVLPARDEADRRPRERAEAPGEILNRRLASGEIDVETYEKLSSTLGASSAVARG